MNTRTVTEPRAARLLTRVLNRIEWAGNKLPHPFWLFVGLSALLAVASALLDALDVSAAAPGGDGTIEARSLLSVEGIRGVVENAAANFTSFPPLATALLIMIGVSVADKTGLLSTALRAAVIRVPPKWVTFTLSFTAMVSHVASDAAYIVLIPLGAIVFRSVGRSPVLGIVVALVAISAGTDASPLITPTDVILSGLSTAAAQTLDPALVVSPVANYYFSLASSIVLSVVITVVVEKFLARRIEQGETDEGDLPAAEHEQALHLTPQERRGLQQAGWTAGVFILLITVAALPPGSPLRGKNGAVVESPLISGIAFLFMLLFLLAGAAYGRAVGAVRTSRDIPDHIAAGLKDLAPILVMFFAVSQFLAYFKWTHLGEIIAVKGSDLLRSADTHTLLIFAGLLVMVSLINLVVTSGSAQWSLVAPIFVPMLMLLDIPPQTTQALYRIADSCTNVVTPVSVYFVMALGFIQRHRRSAGIGTLASMTIPLAACMFVVWTALFLLWWALGIPLGPGSPVR
ncbi:AbgT family transporter [Streptomyces sp. NPDC058373]|uniref:AbgT family transporter n=1 Tax=Streptomyces sp. NPDC058373 TaxID=3346465 RepID=UPI003661DAF3